MHDLIANQSKTATKWSQNVSWRLTGHDSQVSGQMAKSLDAFMHELEHTEKKEKQGT